MRCRAAKCLTSTWLARTAVSSSSNRANSGTCRKISGLQAMDPPVYRFNGPLRMAQQQLSRQPYFPVYDTFTYVLQSHYELLDTGETRSRVPKDHAEACEKNWLDPLQDSAGRIAGSGFLPRD